MYIFCVSILKQWMDEKAKRVSKVEKFLSSKHGGERRSVRRALQELPADGPGDAPVGTIG